jgi:hypothetical protein
MQQIKGLFQSQPDDSPFTTPATEAEADSIPNPEGEPMGPQPIYLPLKSENSLVLVLGLLGIGPVNQHSGQFSIAAQ